MSNPEVGSVFIKVQADGADFGDQVSDIVSKGADEAQAKVDDSIETTAQKILDLRTQSEAASLRALTAQALGANQLAQAETFASQLLDLQANIAQAQFAAEDSMRSAAQAMGAEKEQFLAAAEAYKVAAQIGQDTLDRSQKAGKLVKPDVPDPEGGGGLLSALGGAAAGRTGGLGGITSLLTRLGPLGLAAGAAFQAFNELQGMLRVTGDEAFTTSGKIRNATAELSSLNVIGAVQALTADRPAELTSGLQAGLEKVKQKNDELFLSEDKLLAIRDKSEEGLQVYLAGLALQGNISEETAAQLDVVVNQLFRQREAAEATATAMSNYNEIMARANSETSQFGERGTEFGRGVEALAQQRAASIAQGGPTELPGTGGTDVGNTIRESITSRIRDDKERLAQELEDARLIEAQARATFANLKGTERGAEAYKAVVDATTKVAQTQNQIADAAEQVAEQKKREAKAEAEKAAVDAQNAQEIKLQTAITAASFTERKADDIKAFNAAIDYYRTISKTADTATERANAVAKVQELTHSLETVQAGDPTAALELQTQRLQNAVQAAALTSRLSDDRKAAQDLVKFWKEQVADAEGVAKARAEGSLLDAQARLDAANQAKVNLDEQRIQNRISAAKLTDTKNDDKLAAQALVDFWQKQFDEAQAGADKVNAKARLISAQLAQKSLETQRASGGQGPSTIDILGLNRQIDRDFAGNLLPTGAGAAGAGLLKGLVGLPGGGPEEEQVDELRQIRRLIEQRGGLGANVTVNQEAPRRPDPSGFAEARWARFAMEEAFDG